MIVISLRLFVACITCIALCASLTGVVIFLRQQWLDSALSNVSISQWQTTYHMKQLSDAFLDRIEASTSSDVGKIRNAGLDNLTRWDLVTQMLLPNWISVLQSDPFVYSCSFASVTDNFIIIVGQRGVGRSLFRLSRKPSAGGGLVAYNILPNGTEAGEPFGNVTNTPNDFMWQQSTVYSPITLWNVSGWVSPVGTVSGLLVLQYLTPIIAEASFRGFVASGVSVRHLSQALVPRECPKGAIMGCTVNSVTYIMDSQRILIASSHLNPMSWFNHSGVPRVIYANTLELADRQNLPMDMVTFVETLLSRGLDEELALSIVGACSGVPSERQQQMQKLLSFPTYTLIQIGHNLVSARAMTRASATVVIQAGAVTSNGWQQSIVQDGRELMITVTPLRRANLDWLVVQVEGTELLLASVTRVVWSTVGISVGISVGVIIVAVVGIVLAMRSLQHLVRSVKHISQSLQPVDHDGDHKAPSDDFTIDLPDVVPMLEHFSSDLASVPILFTEVATVRSCLITLLDKFTSVHSSRHMLNSMRLRERMFLANMSHDIRTPLHGILGMLRLLSESQHTAEDADMIQKAISTGDQMLRLLNDILDLSKMQCGQLQLDIQLFHLDPLVMECIDTCRVGLKQSAAVKITMSGTTTPAKCCGDPHRLRQVLFNLLTNAVKYSPDAVSIDVHIGLVPAEVASNSHLMRLHLQGSIGLSPRKPRFFIGASNFGSQRSHFGNNSSTGGGGGLWSGEECVVVAVTDQGRGVPAKQIDTLFDVFSQVQIMDQLTGSGLGLSIAARLMVAMRGCIGCASSVGDDNTPRGSTFWVVLPALTEESGALSLTFPFTSNASIAPGDQQPVRDCSDDGDGDYPEQHASSPHVPSASERLLTVSASVLVVDDNPINRMVASKMLERSGFTVKCADSGESAVEMFRDGAHFSCVIMDKHMPPGIDGYECTRQIHALNPQDKPVPVICCTADLLAQDCQDVSVFEGYVPKPFTRNQLTTAVMDVLTKVENNSSAYFNPYDDGNFVNNQSSSSSNPTEEANLRIGSSINHSIGHSEGATPTSVVDDEPHHVLSSVPVPINPPHPTLPYPPLSPLRGPRPPRSESMLSRSMFTHIGSDDSMVSNPLHPTSDVSVRFSPPHSVTSYP